MSLDLDARQRAMLEAMGIPLLQPLARWREAPPGDVAPAETVVRFDTHEAAADPVAIAVPAPAVVAERPAVPARAEAPPPVRSRPAGVDGLSWEALREAVASCEACRLCAGRTQTVFGVGPTTADWMVVGEAPGEQEDLKGEPFVGQAGKLLDNMLGALALDRRRHVYIANVLKCRPPGNRNPDPEEVAQCAPFLRRQVELLQPKVILAMGRFAVQLLLDTTEPVGRLRGRVHAYHGVPVIVSYHPAYLLRNLPDKAKAWADLCLARSVWKK